MIRQTLVTKAGGSERLVGSVVSGPHCRIVKWGGITVRAKPLCRVPSACSCKPSSGSLPGFEQADLPASSLKGFHQHCELLTPILRQTSIYCPEPCLQYLVINDLTAFCLTPALQAPHKRPPWRVWSIWGGLTLTATYIQYLC